GGLIILLGYVNQFTSVFNDIASQYTQIVKFHTDVQNGVEVEREFDKTGGRTEVIPFPAYWDNIEIENLNFSRVSGGKTNGVKDLSLHITRGKRIALIGESGSGKSTLLSLLRGLHDAQSGAIVKADERSVDFASIGSTVTLFPQEPEIFESTIMYNITLGLPFSEEE